MDVAQSGAISITGNSTGGSLTGAGSLTTGKGTVSDAGTGDDEAISGGITIDMFEEVQLTGLLRTGDVELTSNSNSVDVATVGAISVTGSTIGTDGNKLTVQQGSLTAGAPTPTRILLIITLQPLHRSGSGADIANAFGMSRKPVTATESAAAPSPVDRPLPVPAWNSSASPESYQPRSLPHVLSRPPHRWCRPDR